MHSTSSPMRSGAGCCMASACAHRLQANNHAIDEMNGIDHVHARVTHPTTSTTRLHDADDDDDGDDDAAESRGIPARKALLFSSAADCDRNRIRRCRWLLLLRRLPLLLLLLLRGWQCGRKGAADSADQSPNRYSIAPIA